jgi:uncharacterized protein (TIRG00374 family)
MSETTTNKDGRRWKVVATQAAASLLVLFALTKDADLESIKGQLGMVSIGWLIAATAIKSVSLSLHEVRLWLSLKPAHSRPFWPTVAIGYTSGLANSLLPARGGDVVAIALLKREQGVPVAAATAAVGITAFLEAAVFALFLLGVLILGLPHWEVLIGAAQARTAMGMLTGICLASIVGSIILVKIVAKKRAKESEKKPKGRGIINFVKETLTHTGSSLGSKGPTVLNIVLAFIQVPLLVCCFWALVPTVGLELTPNMPIMAVSGVITFSALSALVLPPSMGAGPAASAVFVFGFFGVSQDQAIAFAAMSWIANTSPVIVLGLWPMLRHIREFGDISKNAAK